MRKKLISYFLIGLISTQLIPFKELSGFIFKNNIDQELFSDFENEEGGENKNDDIKKTLELFYQVKLDPYFPPSGNSVKYKLTDIYFNSRISDDIPTRPPLSLI
jgi:hypothetical protein